MINPFPHNDICNGIIVYLLRASAKIIFQNYIKLHALHYAACFHWLWKPKAAADRAVIRMISSRLPLWNSVRVALRTIAAFSCSKSVSFVVAKKRSEERRVGKECVSTCRARGLPFPSTKTISKQEISNQSEPELDL